MTTYTLPLSLPFDYINSTKDQVSQKTKATTDQVGIGQQLIDSVTDELVNNKEFIALATKELTDVESHPDKYINLSDEYKDYLK